MDMCGAAREPAHGELRSPPSYSSASASLGRISTRLLGVIHPSRYFLTGNKNIWFYEATMARNFRKLSRPSIRRLVPGEKITEHGITFERTGNGDGLFSVNVMADGRRIHRVLGRESEGDTRTQAEQVIEKVRSEAGEGRLSLQSVRRTHVAVDDADCWLLVSFGLNTAMRHREILRARFDWLDLEKRRLFIPRAKGGRREQPITPQLAELLHRERETRATKSGWIFPSPRPST